MDFGNPEVFVGDARYGADSRLHVSFHRKAVKHETKSLEEGRPIYEDADFIRIMVPGDKNTMIDRRVTEGDKHRFAAQYKQWKANQDSVIQSGTPLEAWAALTTAQVAELKGLNIHSVEALADLPDGFAVRIMGANELRTRAKAFIAAAKDTALVQRQAEELAQRDSEMLALRDEMMKMKAQLTKLKNKSAED